MNDSVKVGNGEGEGEEREEGKNEKNQWNREEYKNLWEVSTDTFTQ